MSPSASTGNGSADGSSRISGRGGSGFAVSDESSNAGRGGGGLSCGAAAKASRGIAHLPPTAHQHRRSEPGMAKQIPQLSGMPFVFCNDGVANRQDAILVAPIAAQEQQPATIIPEPMQRISPYRN